MSVSRKCDECGKVKRCKMYTRKDPDSPGKVLVLYLCKPDAKALGYGEVSGSL